MRVCEGSGQNVLWTLLATVVIFGRTTTPARLETATITKATTAASAPILSDAVS